MPSQPLIRPRGLFVHKKMAEFLKDTDGSDMQNVNSVIENFQRKNSVGSMGLATTTTAAANTTNSATTADHQMASNVSSNCSRIASSSSSSSSTQRVHRQVSEMTTTSSSSELQKSSSTASSMLGFGGSIDEIDHSASGSVCGDPLVTFPDSPPVLVSNAAPSLTRPSPMKIVTSDGQTYSTERRVSSSKTVKEAFESSSSSSSSSSSTSNAVAAESQEAIHSDVRFQEKLAAANTLRTRLNMEDISSAEKNFNKLQKASSAQQRQTITSSGMFNQEKHIAQSSQSNFTFTKKGMCTSSKALMSTASSQLSQKMNNGSGSPPSTVIFRNEDDILNMNFDDLDQLREMANTQDVEVAINKYSMYIETTVKGLTTGKYAETKGPLVLNKMYDMICKAWAVPTYGHELGYSLCNTLRDCGGMDMLLNNCMSKDQKIQFSSARLLEQCLTTENRTYVVDNGLEKVVHVVCAYKSQVSSADQSKVSTGLLEHLFKHSEVTCSDVIRLGGLDVLLYECRRRDIETLRHCAGALANLSLYGGAENQELMIKRNVPTWLFTLAFNNDDNIKYYAFLAIAVLVANKEIEAAVLKSETLDLIDPFVTTHTPSEFAKSNLAHAHGQSHHWLERLVPVLSSIREEACNLAAFHFCMEAGIKKQQGKTHLFKEINAIEPLKKVASCPNAIASKFAAQALRLVGEVVPHKLSQQVPLWSPEDVSLWVKQIGFSECARNFVESRVDGDLLLQLHEHNLRDDIGIHNGIRRRRFMREIQNLKRLADYSSRDSTNLNSFLQTIGPEFSIYTYSMLNAGVDKESIRFLSEDQLANECGISNSIHRYRILDSIRDIETMMGTSSFEENINKHLDVFISYRRSTGSQLASLLKVHLQLRGFSVFIDVERLEAGKFDNNLLQSIKQAKNFLLVLTPKALDRCIGDNECKDWVHKEIVAALSDQCNIIPIIDNFSWPEPETLPEDMRNVCKFNGVRWIHDYQDACVEKLERFMRGELNTRDGAASTTLSLARCGGGASTIKSDPSAPNTPLIMGRSPPTYQRTQSNESEREFGGSKD
ncbi:NAD(+) hydrolase sarm1 isoform X2 [Daktulosphaira vitifoliae]|uniref:NAD(+) hydrolase sarm1 isoform X2 n=1 Tax=Daktulosphaira vitifoliae TaxID=58002 RepID=UPI0021A9EFD7|nr:NAD(+) hydrolase sarm1 isoform X2 [Daktulosphaira vitifoliae]